MARKQKAKGFNKFLDFIGLVDADGGRDGDFDAEFDAGRSRSGRAAGKNINLDDEFADEPRMTRTQSRRERPAAGSNAASANDRFDADEGWNTASSRPEYGARTQQRAQSASRPASGRYGSEQRYGSGPAQSGRASARYDGAQAGDDGYYRSGSSYENAGGYQAGSGSYRSGSGYGAYGSSYRRNEDAASAYGASAMTEQRAQSAGSYQRHQTIIFKLRSVEECKEVILALIEKKSVLLNLDELDSLQTQRTMDTMSGASFAIGAKLSRASDRTWLITPSTVEVADSQAEAGGSYGGRYI